MQIVFQLISRDDLSDLRTWHTDSEISRRLSFPTDVWFDYVTRKPTVNCWMARDLTDQVGVVQVDCDGGGLGYLDFAVRPDLRGRGIGRILLAAFLSGPGSRYEVLEGRIAPDNVASLACCRRCGFKILPERDEDGFFQAVFYRSENV